MLCYRAKNTVEQFKTEGFINCANNLSLEALSPM